MRDDEWGPALLEACRPESADRPLYFYVDRFVLAQVSGLEPEQAVSAFSDAYNRRRGRSPFGEAKRLTEDWVRDGRCGLPPGLHALAMTVLAVTEEAIGGADGVYPRQNALLGLEPLPQEPDGYRDHVCYLWKEFNNWLSGPGSEYGRPTAFTRPPRWTHQGWARSQAIVRHRDRLLIEDFLQDQQIPPRGSGQDLGGLLMRLLTWLKQRGSRGSRLLSRVTDEPSRDVLRDVLQDELDVWDGAPRERSRAGLTRGLLTYDSWDGAFGAAIRIDDSLRGVALDTGDGTWTADEHDPALHLSLQADAAHLLSRGISHRLTPHRRVRVGGEAVYAMHDDPDLSAWTQVRSSVHGRRYRVLSDTRRLVALAEQLGLNQPTASPVGGWSWLDGVPSDADPSALRAVGLGALVPTHPGAATLTGGLRLRHSTYLGGGEPDLLLPAGARLVTVDDVELDADAEATLSLQDLVLDPGEHRVLVDEQTLAFRTVTHTHEQAVSGQVGWPGPLGTEQARRLAIEAALAGALPHPHAEPALVLPLPDQYLLLCITTQGELLEAQPRVPRWQQQARLESYSIDVQAAFRGCGDIAVALTRSPRGTVAALSVPPTYVPLPGPPPRPRPDLIAEIFAATWQWHGPADPGRKNALLKAAMQSTRAHTAAPSRVGSATPPVASRHDLASRPTQDNPYDDVLTWLSERPSGRASASDFAVAWQWLCGRAGRHGDAEQWRLALLLLTALGHVERDLPRQQVAIAPAALIDLPLASGLSLLVGGRPRRLFERLQDDDDPEAAVSEASLIWDLQERTPVLPDGRPTGPTAVYVQWDRREAHTADAALQALGAQRTGVTADALLSRLPSIERLVAAGTVLTTQPANVAAIRERTGPLAYTWSTRHDTTAPGLYRFRLPHGDMYAWREQLGQPLVRVDRNVGLWLDTLKAEPATVIEHHVIDHTLIVPRAIPRPPLISRALHLRTGLPPRLLARHRLNSRGEGHPFWLFDNIPTPVAERVGVLLRTEPREIYEPMEMP